MFNSCLRNIVYDTIGCKFEAGKFSKVVLNWLTILLLASTLPSVPKKPRALRLNTSEIRFSLSGIRCFTEPLSSDTQPGEGEEAHDKKNYSYVFNMRRANGTKTSTVV